MKITIRKSVFETNSSSMHSFSWKTIFDKSELSIPDRVNFYMENFGWSSPFGISEIEEVEEKACYLYTAAVLSDKVEEFEDAIKAIAEDLGFEYSFKRGEPYEDGYIDHQSWDTAKTLLQLVLVNEINLINFLFRQDTDCVIVGDCSDIEARCGRDRIKVGGYDYEIND